MIEANWLDVILIKNTLGGKILKNAIAAKKILQVPLEIDIKEISIFSIN